jgi:peptidoglycan/xylan/chitin deacetylase (PgdA/CDA1 family)
MKEKTSAKRGHRRSIREVITGLVVFGIVLVVPVFSLIEFGRFFHGTDNRSGAPLPVMTQRQVDTNTLPPQLFKEPLITVTFDDGFESIYETALPLLQKYGIHSTQYIIPGTTDNHQYVSWKQVEQMQKGGHEIACHTMTHPDLTILSDADLDWQLRECKVELNQRFGSITDFASPYGSQNDRTIRAISKYFDSQRNTNGDPTNGVSEVDVNTADNFNRYNIIGVTVRHDTSVRELQELVAYAKATNGWVVLTYHQADEGTGSQFGVDPEKLERQFKYLSGTNVRIVTIREALQGVKAEKAEF